MRDALNFFLPFRRLEPNHENQLTRALLVVLRLSPRAHTARLRLVAPDRELQRLPVASYDTQCRAVRDGEEAQEPADLISVFLTPEEQQNGCHLRDRHRLHDLLSSGRWSASDRARRTRWRPSSGCGRARCARSSRDGPPSMYPWLCSEPAGKHRSWSLMRIHEPVARDARACPPGARSVSTAFIGMGPWPIVRRPTGRWTSTIRQPASRSVKTSGTRIVICGSTCAPRGRGSDRRNLGRPLDLVAKLLLPRNELHGDAVQDLL